MPTINVGTVLMSAYAIASWYGLYTTTTTGTTDNNRHVLPIALIGWGWAAINIARTRRLDLGIVSFALVVLSAGYERKYGVTKGSKIAMILSSALVAMNYALVPANWGLITRTLAKTKSQTWLHIYFGYCVSQMVFWVCESVRNCIRSDENAGYILI